MTGKLAQGLVRWDGAAVPGPEGAALKGTQPLPPTTKFSGQGRCQERVNSGAADAWSDQSPVTRAQCLPLPSRRLSWKPRLAGWREQWVPPWSLGPCLPHPHGHPAKPGRPLAGAQARWGQGGVKLRSAPWSAFSPWEDGWGRGEGHRGGGGGRKAGSGIESYGLCNGWYQGAVCKGGST